MADETEVQDTAEVTTTEAAAPAEFDHDQIAENISDKFAEVFADADDTVKDVTDAAPVAKETPATEKTEAEAEVTEEKAEEKQEAAATDAPTLPAAYRRSLKAYEWTDEEIEAALKQGGQNFITTAAKLHNTRAKEIAGWAEQGRNARKPQQEAPAGQQAPAPVQAAPAATALKPVDVAALKAKYGEEPIIDGIVGPVNQAIAEINRAMPIIQAGQERQRQAELETLGRQIDGFFGGKDMEAFHATYGTVTAKLTNEQLVERQKVLDMADALLSGSRMQGRPLSLENALTLAHDSVSGSKQENVVRSTIAKQLQQRQRAISLKPNGRSAPAKAKPGEGRKELEAATKNRLAKAFGS